MAFNPRKIRETLATSPLMDAGLFGEANKYRNALTNVSSQEFGQGLSQITNQLAGAGPLADSGAATALRAKLLSGVHARSQQQFADYLRQALNARQQFRYQQALQKQAEKAAKPSALQTLGGFVGGVGGGFLPIPGGR